MSLNPLAPVTDRQSVLNRIAWFSTATALGAIWLLRVNVEGIEAALAQIDVRLEMGRDKILPLPAGYLLPALLVGIVTRVFCLHREISEWLGIRERFEVDVIIQQLAKRSGVDLSQIDDDKLVAHRHEIMRHGFYRFSATTNPEIDLDLVHQALDAWSWFWSGLEAATILVLTSFVLVACGAWNPGALTLSTTLALSALGLPMIRRQCARFAVAQVREICADEQRIAQVRHAFACLTTPPSTAQRRQRAA